uniref:Uncharacterized protein n=2 Tax=Lactuca sativa TaxID=4236 RepID=A0A9R1WV55_LACSA|nr:hypothetical protein LSAT_V11C900469790 [Lactuca sativa]
MLGEYLMKSLCVVLKEKDKCERLLTPTATTVFEKIKTDAAKYVAKYNGAGKYQVASTWQDQYMVGMPKKKRRMGVDEPNSQAVTIFESKAIKCRKGCNGRVIVEGRIEVKIVDKGKMEKLTVVNENERLSKEEIEKMIEDADKYKQEDQEYKKKADVFNALEDCIYNMKKMEHVIVDATTWIEDNQDAIVDEIERMKEQLESMCMPKF